MDSNKDNNAKSLIFSLEKEILGLVEETIPHSSFSLDTNLMDAGLDSISLMDLSMKIYRKYSVDILEDNSSLKDEFTINSIVRSIESKLDLVYDDSGSYPLKKNQLSVYFEQLKKETVEYNIPFMLKFRKNVDLEDFVERLFTSYPYLLSTIENKNNKICLKKNRCSVEIGKLAIENDSLVDETVESLIKPYDVQEGSYLYRVYIIESSQSNFCFFDFNHLLFDGSSIIPFIETVNKILNGENVDVDEIAFYSNILEDKKLESNDYLEEKNFYDSLWNGVDSVSELYNNNDSGVGGGETYFHIDMGSLDAFCGVNSVSASNLFLSVYVFAISKFSLSDKVSLSLIVSGKTPRFSDSVGMFANTLPFAITLDNNLLVNDFMGIIQGISSKMVDGGGLYSVLDLKNDYGYQTPIAYNYRDSQLNFPKLNNDILDFNDLSKDNFNYSFDLILNIDKLENEYVLEFKYSNNYSDELINNFIRVYKLVLKEFLKNQNQKIDKIEYLNEKEKNSLLNELNDTYVDNNPECKTVVDLFEEQVRLNGDGVALVYKDEDLTYGELNGKVNRLARYIIDNNMTNSNFIPLVFDRSPYMIISILAVLKCGCAYVPISPNYPRERIIHIFEDVGADFVLTDNQSHEYMNEIVTNVDGVVKLLALVDVEALFNSSVLNDTSPSNLSVSISLGDPVYVIYTSGSTGTPKGVVIKHKGLYNTIYSQRVSFETFDKNILLFADYTFDAFIFELFISITYSSTVHLLNDEIRHDFHLLREYIDDYDVNMATIPPAILNSNDLLRLDTLIVAGDKTKKKVIDLYLDNNIDVFNAYGPSEDTICSTFHKYNEKDKENNIGKPIHNTTFYILDNNQKLLPKGAVGELYLGGVGLAKEYLNNPKLTNEKFIPNPYQTKKQKKIGFNNRLYKTGDLVRLNEDDDLEYVGRRDFQVKIRGYRIELGEIENTLIKINEIKQTIVTMNNNQLVAYYLSDKCIDDDFIRNELKAYLPDYMIPTHYCHLDAMPLNSSGKVDRNKLQNMEINKNENYQKPNTDLEKEIFDICAEILGYNNFGVINSLFSIGFSSISLITLMNKILNDYQVSLDLRDLLKNNMNIQMVSKLIESTGIREYIKHKKRDYYPLSPQQLTYYQLIKDENFSSSKFDSHFSLTLIDIDPVKLKSAMIKAIEVNPDMKMFFTEIDGEIYQKRCDDLEINMPIINGLVNVHEINDVVSFNLFKAPLFDFKIYYEGNITLILSSFNHTISDGVSIENFFRDVIELYSGKEVSKEVTYFDYVLDLLDSEKNNNVKVEQYLIDKTKDSSLESYFNLTHKKSDSETKYFHFDLNTPQNDIDLFCREFNVSHNTLILSSVVLALKDLFKKEEIYLEYIFNGRDKNIYYDIWGLFRRHFPLFFNLNPKNSVKEYLKNVSEDIGDAVNILPSKKLEEIMYSFSKNSSFKIIYNYHDISEIVNNRQNQFNQNLIAYESPNLNNVNMSENELLINVNRHDKFKLSFSYDVAYFSEMDIENLCNSIDSYLLLLVNNPLKNLEDLII